MTHPEDYIHNFVVKELNRVLEAVADPNFLIEIPTGLDVDKDIDQLRSIVAKTSNVYAQAARFQGVARAEAKIAKARYERSYKAGKTGSNEAEREKNGIEAAIEEHKTHAAAEALVEMADSLESGARVASESARRLLGSVQNQITGERREQYGQYKENDFNTF